MSPLEKQVLQAKEEASYLFRMKLPAASCGVSSSLQGRHSVLDTESSRVFWIPAFAGMTNSRQAAGNAPEGIQASDLNLFYPVEESEEFSFF